MTQSKKSEDTITINLDDTYGTTTTYMSDSIDIGTITITGPLSDSNYAFDTTSMYSSAISGTNDTFSISSIDDYNISWPESTSINPDEVERMCKEYPALEKTWRNFKATYDLVKQDWKGKQDGEDELPF
jgi:hypothetical protein